MTTFNATINIEGDVTDSEIIAVKLENNRQQLVLQDRLLSKVFFEYLTLPTYTEISARVDRLLATWRNKGIREFDFDNFGLFELWKSILQEGYRFIDGPWYPELDRLGEGEWILLKNVQITPFVNRTPGKFFLGGWQRHIGHMNEHEDQYLVSNRMWLWEDEAVRTVGLGDVRVGETDGFYLMQCCSRSYNAWLGSEAMLEVGDGAASSALGFPILIEYRLYNRLRKYIDTYGAVSLSRVYAQLHSISQYPNQEPILKWAPGVPKMCLVVVDRRAAIEPMEPGQTFNAIWTVAADPSMSKYRYCTWGFATGTKEYRKNIQDAVDIVSKAIEKRGLIPIFEFDNEANWFGEDSLFGPRQMKDLSKEMLANRDVRKHALIASHIGQYESSVEEAFREEEIFGFEEEDRRHLPSEVLDIMCRGLGYMDYLDFPAAISCFEKAVEIMPDFAYAWYQLGLAHGYSGNDPERVKLWQRALSEKPSFSVRQDIEEVLREKGI